jgi:hypothetical protein
MLISSTNSLKENTQNAFWLQSWELWSTPVDTQKSPAENKCIQKTKRKKDKELF